MLSCCRGLMQRKRNVKSSLKLPWNRASNASGHYGNPWKGHVGCENSARKRLKLANNNPLLWQEKVFLVLCPVQERFGSMTCLGFSMNLLSLALSGLPRGHRQPGGDEEEVGGQAGTQMLISQVHP